MTIRRTLSGTGRILAAPADSSLAGLWVGDAREVVLELEENEIKLPNFFTPGGGDYNTLSKVSSGSLSIEAFEIKDVTAEMAFLAEIAPTAAGAVSDELQPVAPGQQTFLEYILNTAQTVTIALGVDPYADSTVYPANSWVSDGGNWWYSEAGGTSSGASPGVDTGVVWVDKGTAPTLPTESDFTKTIGGMTLAETYTWPDGAPAKFSYTRSASTIMEALMGSGKEWRIRFEGFNEAESNKPILCDAWKVKFSPASLPLNSEEFAQIDLSGALSIDLDRYDEANKESGFYRYQYGEIG